MKICTNCQQKFEITSDDLGFYEKMQVPPPTFCPDCRFQRRYAWRNERNLYKQSCGICKRDLITIYSPDKLFTILCNECYHGDQWDPLSYGQDFDFSRPFFEQFRELQLKVPRLYAFVFQNVNSEYTNGAAFNKNCYLMFVSDHNEDCSYSYAINRCISTFDCYGCNECELCYDSLDCTKCYKVLFSQDCSDSQNLLFCKNCIGCQDCVGSVNLRNKKYCIFNQQYTKEEYFQKLTELKLETHEGINTMEDKVKDLRTRFINKYYHGQQNREVTGDYVSNSKNSSKVYDCTAVEDSCFINHGHKISHCYDGYVVVDQSQYSYEIVSAITLNNVQFGYCVWHDSDSAYCDTCENCANVFGCVGLRKHNYCILNKQYTKEEYTELVLKIIEHMKSTGEYGEFFPIQLSPFAYNETVAQEYVLLTKEEAVAKGYQWKDPEKRNYQIGGDIVACEHNQSCEEQCTQAFRLIPQELEFYQRMRVPIPLLCPNCRHGARLKKRNPRKLWKRKCVCSLQNHFHGGNNCPNEFETTISPDRSEGVYCEKCYQAEVA